MRAPGHLDRILNAKKRVNPERSDRLVREIFHEISLLLREPCETQALSQARRRSAIVQSVTALEVFCRNKIRELLDKSEDVRSRSVSLFKEVKFDIEIIEEIGAQRVTLGDIAAHSINISSVVDIVSRFEILFGKSLRECYEEVLEEFPDQDFSQGECLADLARLFEVRHILVHENPTVNHLSLNEISRLSKAALQTVDALTLMSGRILWSDWGKTQVDLNTLSEEEYSERLQVIEDRLQNLRKVCGHKPTAHILETLHHCWKEYLRTARECAAEAARGGSAEAHFRNLEGIEQCSQFMVNLDRIESRLNSNAR